jgi:hypothetical protein
VAEASSVIQRMQKVMTEMNMQLGDALSDLSGVSGMNIIQAILKGERDPWQLAPPGPARGEGRPRGYCQKLGGELARGTVVCAPAARRAQPLGPRPKGKKSSGNAPAFDLRSELYRITGIDWSQVNGIDVLTAQTMIAEAGADLSAFLSEKQFTSWLGLFPTNQQSEEDPEPENSKSSQSGHGSFP